MIFAVLDMLLEHNILFCFVLNDWWFFQLLYTTKTWKKCTELVHDSKHIGPWTFLYYHHSTKNLNLYWISTFALTYFLALWEFMLGIHKPYFSDLQRFPKSKLRKYLPKQINSPWITVSPKITYVTTCAHSPCLPSFSVFTNILSHML